MDTDNKTCAQLVEQKMMERNIQLEEYYDKLDDGNNEEREEATEELNNLALEISEYKVVKILLSTGGPGDWIEVKVDDDGDIRGMTYHYHDWFDHAQTTIYNDSYLWDYAKNIVDLY